MVNFINELRFLREKRAFFNSYPDVYLVFRENHIRQYFVEVNNELFLKFSFFVNQFKRAESSFIVVFLSDTSKRDIKISSSEKDYFVLSMNLVNYLRKLRVTEIWLDANVFMNYSNLFNYVFYNLVSNRQETYVPRQFKVVILCFSLKEFEEIFKNSDVFEYFHVTYYLNAVSGDVFTQTEKIIKYLDLVNNFNLDFDINYVMSLGIDNYFSFLDSVMSYYCDNLIARGIRIKVFDYFLKNKPSQCFSGDCIKNTITIDSKGDVYLCAKCSLKALNCGRLFNIFSLGFDLFEDGGKKILQSIFLYPLRLQYKKLQGRKVCNCDYWELCFRGCNVFNFKNEGVKCREFFGNVKKFQNKYYSILLDFDRRKSLEKVKNLFK